MARPIDTGHAIEHPAKFSLEGLTYSLLDEGNNWPPVTIRRVRPEKNLLPRDILIILHDLMNKVKEAVQEFDNHLATLGPQVEAGNLTWVNDYELSWEAHNRLRLAAQAFQKKKYQSPEHAKLVEPFNKHLEELLEYEDQQMADLIEMKEAFEY
ncbi:MAG: hypothetical protein Q9187_001294 [Circinaria calcarea]